MIDTKALREKILDLAMRGKLVPQDPNDEPASELLKRIKAEKEELIKQKKIKRDKNETEIFRGDDGLHYEKFADGTIKEIEVPYELPAGWEWARINKIYWNLGQKKPDSKFYYLDTGAVNNSIQKLNKSNIKQFEIEEAPSRARKIVQRNSIIFSTVRSYLKNIAVVDVSNTKNYIASTAFIVLDSLFDTEFLLNLLISKNFLLQVEQKSTGSNYPAINERNFNSLFVPVPPIGEQKRIGFKIRKLFNNIEHIEGEQEQLQQLATQLKQKVLDVAMQGKLVPQDPNDEPASVLLEKIRAEKQRLYEDGKIKKKDLVETEIVKDGDNAYYQNLPENWSLTRFNNIISIVRGSSPRPIKSYLTEAKDGINWIKIGDTKKGDKYINSTTEKIKVEGIQKTRLVHKGDFLLSNSMSFGRPYILKIDGAIHDGWLAISNYQNYYTIDFLYWLLSSNLVAKQFRNIVSGTAVKNLNTEKVAQTIIPILSMNEQHKISEKLDSLHIILDKLQ